MRLDGGRRSRGRRRSQLPQDIFERKNVCSTWQDIQACMFLPVLVGGDTCQQSPLLQNVGGDACQQPSFLRNESIDTCQRLSFLQIENIDTCQRLSFCKSETLTHVNGCPFCKLKILTRVNGCLFCKSKTLTRVNSHPFCKKKTLTPVNGHFLCKKKTATRVGRPLAMLKSMEYTWQDDSQDPLCELSRTYCRAFIWRFGPYCLILPHLSSMSKGYFLDFLCIKR